MARYKYKAMTAAGIAVKGIYEAKSKNDVLTMLRQNQYFPVKIVEQSKGREIELGKFFNRISNKDIAVFCRQFHSMLEAGISLINCLDILKQQTENKYFRSTIGEVYEKVQQGLTFSEALKRYDTIFPDMLINMIVAGEASGGLDTILERMANHYEKETRILNKVKGAMIYPMALAFLSVGVSILLLVFVFPNFISMFEGSDTPLPLPTRILMSVSSFLTGYWYIVIGIVILTVIIVRRILKNTEVQYKLDSFKLKIPIIKGINQKVITSRFSRTLATLISSGMPLLEALDIVARILNNKYVEQGILKAKDEVRRGVLLSVPIKEMNLFPPMLISMLSIGEEVGTLDEILNKTANYFDEEAETAIDTMTRLVEPMMLIVMALLIGFIVAAMMLPMFDMASTVAM